MSMQYICLAAQHVINKAPWCLHSAGNQAVPNMQGVHGLHARLSWYSANVAQVANSVVAAYDSGELPTALAEGTDAYKGWVKALGKAQKRKGKRLFMPLRVALTGTSHVRTLHILGLSSYLVLHLPKGHAAKIAVSAKAVCSFLRASLPHLPLTCVLPGCLHVSSCTT